MSTVGAQSDSPATATQPPVRATLKARMLRAGGWSMGTHMFGQVLRLASSLIMTRLLVPEVFGVMTIVTMVQVVLALLSDIGLRQSIMQSRRGNSPDLLNTAWTMQVIRGCAIWGICTLLAAGIYVARSKGWLPAGTAYTSPDLPAVLAVASLTAAILGFQSTKASTAQRDLNLKRITMIELLAQVVGLAIAGVLGWLTRSIWSFVVSMIVSALITTVLSHTWLPGQSNRFQWCRDAALELFGFGRWVLVSSLLYVLSTNADRMFLGGWVSATTLGLYSIAFNLATMVEGAGSRLFSSVTLAALSEVARNEPHRFGETYRKMRPPFDAAFIGAAGFLCAAGPAITHLLYDSRYSEAGWMLQVLSFGLIFARFGLTGSAYMALGEPRNLMWIHVVKVVSVFTLIPILNHFFGMKGVLVAIAFHVVPTLPLMYWFNRKHGLDSWRLEFLCLLSWPAAYAIGLLMSWAIGY